ncbi:hypothetical protein [Caulobacter segnis]|uniref:Uncharacterized protein n=1 Tax=Caulobacter segnis TaxID=88688 RepID=A0A2W5V0N2_9CAUL|nr:hypothetical protein [Caulobacter segnis]PZR32287.1 MAG: hypothetical protein DI526_17080 [Caulobacter segnis]
MRYRLLVNLPGKMKAGSPITPEDVGQAEFDRLGSHGFIEIEADELADVDAFTAALEAYRLHMEAAPPLIIAVLEATNTDDQVIAFADALFEISSTVPKRIQEVMAEVFERARELAVADPNNIPNSAFASLLAAQAEGAAGMDAAPDNSAPAADQVAGATNPEGGAVAAATVVTPSTDTTLSVPDGAAAATAASNDTPKAEDLAVKKSPAAKSGGRKKSEAA